MKGALPATRFAVEAYVTFVREQHAARRGRLLAHRAVRAQDPQASASPACSRTTTSSTTRRWQYFKRRLDQANRDADFALDYVKRTPRRREEQEACVDAVRFKCNVLWAQLDALHHAYVAPG